MLMMLPIHLAIGVVEGMATAAVVAFVARARPEALPASQQPTPSPSFRPVLLGIAVATLVLGGIAGWFASTKPDGLEWSIAKMSRKAETPGVNGDLHTGLAALQEKTAFLPNYGFKSTETIRNAPKDGNDSPDPWPAVNAGTSISGIVGGLVTLALTALFGLVLTLRRTAS
jgi:cobalt/nickel transport system permease protein